MGYNKIMEEYKKGDIIYLNPDAEDIHYGYDSTVKIRFIEYQNFRTYNIWGEYLNGIEKGEKEYFDSNNIIPEKLMNSKLGQIIYDK